mmetsp:Transcript_16882/g.25427  ORF Transcript_16882/g.25427 Transcript_16882/m.25427 type:complete len:493 (-) Transcript_16882:166-1644(-)|eukprot:CAMPEP_0185022692 /NCGR_PEP_ID=MMETSP1103-20130426/5397_1 /TAXON_ID=36769 /ORGANISM="Paraphysomonas bandaiensis, Strain Caron Lab Isolate" /LENGTH=492 /DNA_ID=CAMNT_0027554883 /DNA_START=130 /DNA_END=1608 /DNA_ORIENTATION=-
MSKDYSPDVIAQSFVKQFYEMLTKNPGELHRFYKDESAFSHSEGHQVAKSVTGIENIREYVNSLNLAGARIDFREGSIDAQHSDHNGVFLVVTGLFTKSGNASRPFVQSFFLACQSSLNQKTTMASYYVRNSVFRLLSVDRETSGRGDASFGAPPPEDPTCRNESAGTGYAPVNEMEMHKEQDDLLAHDLLGDDSTRVDNTTECTDAPATVDSGAEVLDTTSVPTDTATEVNVDAATVISEPDYVNVSLRGADDVEAGTGNQQPLIEQDGPVGETTVAPRSFADLVKSWSSDSPAVDLTGASGSGGASGRNVRTGKVATATDGETAGSGSDGDGKCSSSLYVNQLGENTSEADLAALFGDYGNIKKIDVHSRGYAFVDFQDSSSVSKVLAKLVADPCAFSVRGVPIHVAERQQKAGNKSTARTPRERGIAGSDKRDNRGGAADKMPPKRDGGFGKVRAGGEKNGSRGTGKSHRADRDVPEGKYSSNSKSAKK